VVTRQKGDLYYDREQKRNRLSLSTNRTGRRSGATGALRIGGGSKSRDDTARMELGAERILRLIIEGKQDEAVALMNTETWGVEVEEGQEEAGDGQTHPGH